MGHSTVIMTNNLYNLLTLRPRKQAGFEVVGNLAGQIFIVDEDKNMGLIVEVECGLRKQS